MGVSDHKEARGNAGFRVGRRVHGQTLPEILISGTLLALLLGLVATPIMMTIRSMQKGQARLDSQHLVREPVDRMVAEVINGYQMEITAPSPSPSDSNSLTYYDTRARDNLKVTFRLDATNQNILKDVSKYAGGTFAPLTGSPFVFARGATYLSFVPKFVPEASPGTWQSYTLPIPNPNAADNVPPVSNVPPPQGTLILVRLIGVASPVATASAAPDAPALDLSTSISVRN